MRHQYSAEGSQVIANAIKNKMYIKNIIVVLLTKINLLIRHL